MVIYMLNKKQLDLWINMFYLKDVQVTIKNQSVTLELSDGTVSHNTPIAYNGLVVELDKNFLYLIDESHNDMIVSIADLATIQTLTKDEQVDPRLKPNDPVPDMGVMN